MKKKKNDGAAPNGASLYFTGKDLQCTGKISADIYFFYSPNDKHYNSVSDWFPR